MRAPAPAIAARRSLGRTMTPAITAQSQSVAPPVRGWNTVLPLANMDPDWAIQLDNWFPQPGYVEVRGGHVVHSDTEVVAPVETVMAYHGSTVAEDELFAAVDEFVFNVTLPAAVQDISGLTSSRFQHINFTTPGGKFLYIVNGEDNPRYYDGTSWATPTITGITPADIIHINAHKGRIWFILKESTTAAYLSIAAIQGEATTFELGSEFKLGGYLVAMGTWSRDGGDGPDDYAVFISSKGEIVVYQGTDPNNASTWSKIGRFTVGPPIGRRCMTGVGADLAIITIDGVLPMSLIPGVERGAASRIALTANIQPTMNAAARGWKENFGWQLISYPRGTRAMLNVPAVEGDTQQQYVMNTVTGAWCRFRNWNANCFEVWQDRLFFGGNDGVVYEADRGQSDNGAPITANAKTAFNYFGERGRLKRWHSIRPLITTDGALNPAVTINVDFADAAQLDPGDIDVSEVAIWDESFWDNAVWPPEQFFNGNWQTISGIGYCASTFVSVAVLGGAELERPVLQLNGFDFLWEGARGMYF